MNNEQQLLEDAADRIRRGEGTADDVKLIENLTFPDDGKRKPANKCV